MGISFAVLGSLEVHLNGAPVRLTAAKQRLLVAVLVLHRGEVVSRDALIEALWRGVPPASATAVVQNHIHLLRKAFDPDGTAPAVVDTVGTGYRLTVDAAAVDAASFEDLAARGRQAQRDGQQAQAAELLRAALALWRGPAYSEVAHEDPIRAEAQRLDTLRAATIEDRLDAELQLGHHAELVGEIEARIAEHPLRERLWAQLMRSLYRSGRQTDALRAYQRVRTLLGDELGLEPGPELTLLEGEILAHKPIEPIEPVPPPTPPRRGPDRLDNLPRAATSFVGRAQEVQRITAEVTERQLVTLSGTGGVGKTRLSTEAARATLPHFPDGVWFVELAPVTDPESVVAAVAGALTVQAQHDMPMVEAIVDWLRGRRLLLVIDNCEHVLQPIVELIGAIVAGCPTTTVLVTSREPLGLPGERVHLVQPLDPDREGVELFCDRAVEAYAAFAPAPSDRPIITDICRRLDGIPLAIELAAPRVRSFSPTELLFRVDHHFALLRSSGRVGVERHHSLQAAVTWSYELLTSDERLVFDRLSVFAGGFNLTAAEAVCGGGGIDGLQLVDIVSSLVDKSMVVADPTSPETRYRLLETLRQYGEARLEERGETSAIRDRHLRHYTEVASRANRLWGSVHQFEGDAIFDREWDNLRLAQAWAVTTGHSELAEALLALSGAHAWYRMRIEHGDWAVRILGVDSPQNSDSSAPTGRRPNPTTYAWAANWAFIGGDHDGAILHAHKGIDAAPAPDHPDTTGCWAALTWASIASGRGDRCLQPAQAAQLAAVDNPDPHMQAWAHVAAMEAAFACNLPAAAEAVDSYARWAEKVGITALLSGAAFYQGHLLFAAQHSTDSRTILGLYRRGLDLAGKAGDINNEGKNLIGSVIAATRFQVPEAGAICRDSLLRLYDARYWPLVWIAVDTVARWLAANQELEPAAILYGHMEVHHAVWDTPAGRRGRSRGIALVRQHPAADQLLAEGAAMSREELIDYVLGRLPPSRPREA